MLPVSSSGWVDVRVSTVADAGDLLAAVQDCGAIGAWECDGSVHLYWPAERWDAGYLEAVRLAARRFVGAEGLSDDQITVHVIPDTDWNARWAASVKPVRVGRRIVIRPSWEPGRVEPDDIELVLDPKQAFGTGHHATTQLLLEWEEALVRGGERVLDIGTGSGILAMAALRLGAKAALGIDHDPVAIACAKGYAADNGFGPELQLAVATLEAVGPATRAPLDLILANLDTRTLVASARPLASHLRLGARVLASGLLAADRIEVCRAFDEQGGACLRVREREGWLALELVMAEGCEGCEGDASGGTMRPNAAPRLHQISVSGGGVPKRPVPEARVTAAGVDGDRQRTKKIHGGPERAVCLFSLDVIEMLGAEGHAMAPGVSGENLTLAGVDWPSLRPGHRLRVGETVELEITSYTDPCERNARWFLDGAFTRISQAHYPGCSRLYARVLKEGVVRTGDPVMILTEDR